MSEGSSHSHSHSSHIPEPMEVAPALGTAAARRA